VTHRAGDKFGQLRGISEISSLDCGYDCMQTVLHKDWCFARAILLDQVPYPFTEGSEKKLDRIILLVSNAFDYLAEHVFASRCTRSPVHGLVTLHVLCISLPNLAGALLCKGLTGTPFRVGR